TYKALGFEFQEVVINGVAASFMLVGRANWFMRFATLLEGRAVIACLQWMLWNFEGHPQLGRILLRYVTALYPPEGNYDYRCLLDISAAWLGCKSLETAFEKDPKLVRNALYNVDAAAWFALQAATKQKKDAFTHENVFLRFVYALEGMQVAYATGYRGSPMALLAKLDLGEGARVFGFLPLQHGVCSTIRQLAQARDELLPLIWNREVRDHFGYIFGELQTALGLRFEQGYDAPLAASYKGCSLLYIDEAHQFLLKPYNP